MGGGGILVVGNRQEGEMGSGKDHYVVHLIFPGCGVGGGRAETFVLLFS